MKLRIETIGPWPNGDFRLRLHVEAVLSQAPGDFVASSQTLSLSLRDKSGAGKLVEDLRTLATGIERWAR